MRGNAFGRRFAQKLIKLHVLVLASLLMVGVASAPPAEARTHKSKEAKSKKGSTFTIGTGAIIINEATGEVLYARNADKKLYPASMTKVMTLYLTFEALENGTLTLDSKLPVSRAAASRPPSKLGLTVGSSISVEDAILALVTRSANDAAAVLAEGLGGTEADFGYLMTAKARELGMKNTIYRNASGLPDKQQVSTPRDQALLGVAIHRNFPEYYAYFSTRSFTYKGVTHTSHNRFALNYKGADGIKTGFIGMSGFNLLAAAQRDGTRLVGVVFGGSTAASRDRYMGEIMDASFARAKGNDLPGVEYVKDDDAGTKSLAAVKPEPLVMKVKVAGFPQETAPKAKVVTMTTLDDQLAPTDKPVVMPASLAMPAPRASQADAGAMRPVEASATSVTSAALETGESDAEAATLPQGWAVQVGAFSKRDAARDFAQKVIGRLSDTLEHVTASVSTAGGKKTLYRSRLVGFASRSEAQDACTMLKRGKVSCIIVAPGTATASLD
ncbi:D-alanyl-D-alanine carboxypeptidase [Emcibacter sp. SYSU 3D8]|uniref:D-alanyl-D-alanine carboxypeptidase n=1 Tax=Emcibacter sp. SYSU 3D8 TaxID=3133969 RepID=UPI0031FF00AC